jgi:hypothetical protein
MRAVWHQESRSAFRKRFLACETLKFKLTFLIFSIQRRSVMGKKYEGHSITNANYYHLARSLSLFQLLKFTFASTCLP